MLAGGNSDSATKIDCQDHHRLAALMNLIAERLG
jgi:hypothetical protein